MVHKPAFVELDFLLNTAPLDLLLAERFKGFFGIPVWTLCKVTNPDEKRG